MSNWIIVILLLSISINLALNVDAHNRLIHALEKHEMAWVCNTPDYLKPTMRKYGGL